MERNIVTRLKRKDIRDIFAKNHIEHVYLVGSYARGEQTDKSDVDLVYEMQNQDNFSLFHLIKIKQNLEKKLSLSVDLVHNEAINKHYKSYIDNDKILVF